MTRFSLRLAALGLAVVSATALAVTPVNLIVKQGDSFNFPGPVTRTVSTLNTPFTNGLGHVGFVAAFDDATRGIWQNNGWIFVSPAGVTGGEGTMGIGNAPGTFIYSPAVSGNDAVYTNGGSLLKGTDPIPALPGRFSTFNSRPTMLPDGKSHWMGGSAATAGGATSNRHLFRASDPTDPLSITVIFSGGDIIDGKPISSSASHFDYHISDNGNHHIHVLDMVTGSSANNLHLYLNGGFVAQEGSPAGDGTNWLNFETPSVNNFEQYVFSGSTTGPTASDNFLAYNGSIKVREGQSLDGILLATGAAVRAASINNLGQVAHIWGWGTGATLREHLFFAPSGDLISSSVRLLSIGDLIDVDGDTFADYTVTDFKASTVIGPGLDLAEDGKVCVELGITPPTGGEVEAIVCLAIPEPASAALVALGGLLLSRRRRR